MLNMWNKYLAMLYFLLWNIFLLSGIEAQVQTSASAVAIAGNQDQVPAPLNPFVDAQSQSSSSAVAVTGYQPQEPNLVVVALAESISEGLQHSAVLGEFANFAIDHPYDIFFEISMRVLIQDGLNYTSALPIAIATSEAAEQVGVVTSKLYFDTVGYTTANFLFVHGIATIDNVNALSLSIVNAVGVRACVEGLVDAASVINAVVNGVYDAFVSYGLINYDNVVYYFYLFAELIKVL